MSPWWIMREGMNGVPLGTGSRAVPLLESSQAVRGVANANPGRVRGQQGPAVPRESLDDEEWVSHRARLLSVETLRTAS